MKIKKNNYFDIWIFLIPIFYFYFWNKNNFPNIISNNQDIYFAIETYNFTPYISLYFSNFIKFFFPEKFMIFLGNIFFPSLVFFMIYKIFYKLLLSRLWAISIALLSLTSTENYPFIKFFISFVSFDNFLDKLNNENFEIIGFPIPSFSIFFFLSVYYIVISNFSLSRFKLYFLTILWILNLYIHPLDGVIGCIFWYFYILIKFIYKKNILKKDLLIITLFYILNAVIFATQIDFKQVLYFEKQNYDIYHFVVYFFVPLVLLAIAFISLKIDKFEFFQKFLNIYILMFVEFVLIIFSINGFGIDFRILETRISMFLLHFLYYVPIIYYLSRDENTYFSTVLKKNYAKNKFSKPLYYIFNKSAYLYLLPINFIIIMYFILTLTIFYE